MSTTTTRIGAAPASPAPLVGARFAGLDGLRAIAVLAVILFHFVPSGVGGGFIGVDVFFVISGFLITALLVRERERTGRIALGAFWARRARRLLPALALVVSVCGGAALIVGGDVLVGLGAGVVGAATFSSNWIFIAESASYFDETSPELFRNLWSLAVEEQFYLVWPIAMLALLAIPGRWLRVALVAALAVASAVAMALLVDPADLTRVYYGTDTHAFGLALGAALALGSTPLGRRWERVLPVVGAVALGGIVALSFAMPADDPIVARGGLALVALLTAIVIAGATARGSWLGRVLDAGPLAWIGERSYGLYLWHWPVIVLLIAALPAETPQWIAPSVAIVLTTGAAAASYRFVEVPIRSTGFRLAAATRPRRALIGGAAFALASALTLSAIVVAPASSQAQAAIELGQKSLAGRAHAAGPSRPAPLPTGDQIYAIGDSVMLASAPWLQERLPGIAIDAEVSRSMWVAPQLVQAAVDAGVMRPILVLGLATNGDVDPADLQAVRDILGPDRQLILVNGQAPRDWIPIGNQTIAQFAAAYREVDVANWHDAIAPQVHELASDQVHPGGPLTGGIYANAVCDALQRLAELPPRRDELDAPGVNRPA